MPGAIDYNRPLTCKTCDGKAVYEFKDNLGTYFDITGKEITDLEFVKLAGFDVAASLREKRRNELRGEAEKRIDKELKKEFAAIDAGVDPASVTADTEGVQIMHRGGGKYRVELPDGTVLLDKASRQQADAFVRELEGD